MAPTKTAIVQAKIRHELRHLHENHEVPEDIQRMAAMFLDLMHKLAHNTIAVADVVDAEHRMESFLTANSKSKHIAVFESAMLEMTRAVVVTALQESLHALLSFGAFVPAALRFWKRQLKNPLELFLLALPDKVFVLPGGDISTDEKIRVLDETYETLLASSNIVGEILLSKKALIQDPLALKDSKESLQRMLADFIHDTNPSMPLAQQQAMQLFERNRGYGLLENSITDAYFHQVDEAGVVELATLSLDAFCVPRYFDEDEQKRFEEDVTDLVGEHMLVSQQLAVIARMHHSHAFLVKGVSSKWFH
ncbi:hypothetical protein DYB32_001311 [Aphanomyces invadans]|uniref:Uncharacterized protein n=1 Tax=Aphanomyces invadans TaxID=157072 RepID=A0A3R7AEH9_9STRA|nr:hypothetical protein DYB32_001311 [Aphanomyces invadans]